MASAQNPVSRDTVILAFQIQEFLDSNHSHSDLIDERSRQLTQYLVTRNFRPQEVRRELPTSAREDRARSRSNSIGAPSWPSNWAVSKPHFRESLKKFSEGTRVLRRLHEPPSTGATPHTTPDSSPPPTPSNLSTGTGDTTRATSTSAEEEARRKTPEPPPKMATNFSEEQRNEMAAIIAQAMTIVNQAAPQGQARPATEARPPQFRPRDIGYFDPDPQAAPVEVKDTHNVYHNVFGFTNRLRVKATTMDAATLRQNIESCLLGAADDWYTNQLTHISRVGLRNDPDGVKEWCDALEARFRDSPGKSLTLLESVRYTVRDARNKKDPADYVSSIVLNSKNAGIATTDAAQVLLAYEHIDGELRRDLPRPTEASTVSSLLEELRHQKDI